MMEAMATGFTTGRLGEDGAVDDLITKQHHQPLGRTYEFFLARAPAHALRDRQVVEGIFDDGRQQTQRWLARNALAVAQFRAALIDFAQVYAALLGEAQGSLSRIAIGIECGLAWRAVQINAAIRLLGGKLTDQHGQATRRGIDLLGAVSQTGSLQAFFDTGHKRIGQGIQCFGWQFFSAQFNQKILSTHCAASSLANTSSRISGAAIGKPSLARAIRYAWATERARVRTRRMYC